MKYKQLWIYETATSDSKSQRRTEMLSLSFGVESTIVFRRSFLNQVNVRQVSAADGQNIFGSSVRGRLCRRHRYILQISTGARGNVCFVIDFLTKYSLLICSDKSRVGQKSILLLGFIISGKGVQKDPAKLATIAQWERPKNTKQLLSFLGAANYYRQFIPGFSAP